MKVAIKTLGCKLNQAESEKITRKLLSAGFELVDFKDRADLYLINSCSVTNIADRKSRQAVHFVKNRYPSAKIWGFGCSHKLASEIKFLFDKNQIVPEIIEQFSQLDKPRQQKLNLRTRTFIKIQEGCDNFCSYCIVPYLRGRPRSISANKIIKEIDQRVQEGFKEVVLTGVNIGKYGREISNFQSSVSNEFQISNNKTQKVNLSDLLKLILRQTKIERIRLGSVNPEDINENFIKLFKNPRMCQHLHLSLQSGSNSVLRRMGRRYTTEMYKKIVQKFYSLYPNFSFTTDIIVGFPGEIEREFKETCDFIRQIGFLKVHIFRYSRKKGTAAAIMENQINEKVKKERADKLTKIADGIRKKFQRRMIGKEFPVLFEKEKNGYWYGFTHNYLRVRIKNNKNLENKILRVKINKENLVF